MGYMALANFHAPRDPNTRFTVGDEVPADIVKTIEELNNGDSSHVVMETSSVFVGADSPRGEEDPGDAPEVIYDPDWIIADVQAWVIGDGTVEGQAERVAVALDAEQGRAKPRPTLVAWLNERGQGDQG